MIYLKKKLNFQIFYFFLLYSSFPWFEYGVAHFTYDQNVLNIAIAWGYSFDSIENIVHLSAQKE